MPLQKTITVSTVLASTYWTIAAVHHDFIAQTTAVTLFGYPTKSAKDAGDSPSDVRTLNPPFTPSGTANQLYSWLKTQSDFTGATDI